MKVLYLPEIVDQFEELSEILYRLDYFGLRETAKKYVDDLIDEIEASIETRPRRIAPPYFDKYGKGMQYMWFNLHNSSTQWFVFFTVYQEDGETIYLVRYLGTNHVVTQHL
ncbi:MAG: hypothetical protein LIO77_05505 [Rikenellaceae bacterium]|nr:hypothetical protein [Rikenellaceae bacterium]